MINKGENKLEIDNIHKWLTNAGWDWVTKNKDFGEYQANFRWQAKGKGLKWHNL